MGRSGREARSGGAAGTSRGFWTCCFSRTQDGAQSWRLLSAGDGINRSLPGVGGGGAGRSHSPSPPAGEVQSASPPLAATAGIPHPPRTEGEGAAPTPASPPPWMVQSGPQHLSGGGGTGAILFTTPPTPPKHCGRLPPPPPNYSGPLAPLAPWLDQVPHPRLPGRLLSSASPARPLAASPRPRRVRPPPGAGVVGAD